MDRNFHVSNPASTRPRSLSARRAWIEILVYLALIRYLVSLSARRAWIEISITQIKIVTGCVALRKESVDRNSSGVNADSLTKWSLSARRAWIEILFGRCYTWIDGVALRKESVDRNAVDPPGGACFYCRSPQGERG